jgi:putative ABC transport system ATP-binding protein
VVRPTPAIELEDVTVLFNKGTADELVALNRVSLSVYGGECVVLTGDNGSGKSTVLNAIAGLCPVASGTIKINSRDVTRVPEHERLRGVGYVHQDPTLGTCPALTVHQNAQLYVRRPWWSPAPIPLRLSGQVTSLLQATGLPLLEKVGSPVSMLSGGQRQALAVCLTLSANPSILLLDECLSSLDRGTAARVLDILRGEGAKCGLTTLMVVHDPQRLRVPVDRVVALRSGMLETPARPER